MLNSLHTTVCKTKTPLILNQRHLDLYLLFQSTLSAITLAITSAEPVVKLPVREWAVCVFLW